MSEEVRRDFLSDALDLVIADVTSARELCEVGLEWQEGKVRLHLLQALAALEAALAELEKPQ